MKRLLLTLLFSFLFVAASLDWDIPGGFEELKWESAIGGLSIMGLIEDGGDEKSHMRKGRNDEIARGGTNKVPYVFVCLFIAVGFMSFMGLGYTPIRFLSEAELPAEPGVWSGCCSHHDCKEGRVRLYQESDPSKATVGIDDYKPFSFERSRIHPSKNGRDYFCRRDLTQPPDSENTRCVFVGRPSYVKNL